jgi:hypothetical protein
VNPPPPCVGADRFDEVLQKAGLTRADVRYTVADWSIFPSSLAHDAFRLPFFDEIHDHPLRAPGWARALVKRLDRAADSARPVAAAIQVAASALGHEIEACARPPVQGTEELVRAVMELFDGTPEFPDEAAIRADAGDLPPDLAGALAAILRSAADAARARDTALAGVAPELRQELFDAGFGFFLRSMVPVPRLTDPAVRRALTEGIRYGDLYRGAANLAATIEAAGLRRFAGTRGFSFSQPTPLGRVVVRDAADHTYHPDDPVVAGDILLLVDTGGNDTYLIGAGANESLQNPVSILIDLAGDDHYEYVEVPDPGDGARLPSDSGGRYQPARPPTEDDGPVSLSLSARQGSGRLGIGFLFDLGGGNDRYRSLRISQGCGVFGVGVLYDDGGDDRYQAEAGAQGAGAYGIGILLDAAGNDSYSGYHALQGFGWVMGAGVIYDGAGHDQYLADLGDPERGGDPLYYTPQLPGRGNSSFAQGVGFGRRADVSLGGDGVYQSGGLGVLRDRSGNDRYQASVFGIGSGYWFGTGVFADGAGDDEYDGLWYVLGANAHFALTVFLDDDGHDRYNQRYAPVATSIGVGHDLSVAWHIDSGGNDHYRAPGLSLGSGNVNGYGFLVNLGGDDTYLARGEPTLGAGNLSGEANQPGNPRRQRQTIGIFLDVGGTDRYRVGDKDLARDSRAWKHKGSTDPTLTTEHGAGLDAADGEVCLGP